MNGVLKRVVTLEENLLTTRRKNKPNKLLLIIKASFKLNLKNNFKIALGRLRELNRDHETPSPPAGSQGIAKCS